MDARETYKAITRASLVETQSSDVGGWEEGREWAQKLSDAAYLTALLRQINNDLQGDDVGLIESALTALGYVLSGIWIPDSQASPLSSAIGDDSLVVSLLRLLGHNELRISLLVVFVISNQSIPDMLLPHYSSLLGEISRLLLSSKSISSLQGKLVLHVDVAFSQCLSALVVLAQQLPEPFARFCPAVLLSTTFDLVVGGATQVAAQYAELGACLEDMPLLSDMCSVLRACSSSSAVHLLPKAHSTLADLSEIVKKLLSKSSVGKETIIALDLARDLWMVWLHLLASLIHSPTCTPLPASAPSQPQMIDATRKKLSSTTPLHKLTQLTEDGRLKLSPLERKIMFFDLVTPLNSVGMLVLPLQRMTSASRCRAAQCYLLLTQQVVAAESWHQPSGVLKLLLRCIHHLMFVPPAPLASKLTAEPTEWTDAEAAALDDYCAGIYFCGHALGNLVAGTAAAEIMRIVVSTGSSRPTDLKSVSVESLLAVLEEKAADMPRAASSTCADGESPRKRARGSVDPKVTALSRVWQNMWQAQLVVWAAAAQAQLGVYEVEHCTFGPSVKCNGPEGSSGGDSLQGLFSCRRGFRKEDVRVKHGHVLEVTTQPLERVAVLVLKLSGMALDAEETARSARSLCEMWQRAVLVQVKAVFLATATEHGAYHATQDRLHAVGSQAFSQGLFSGSGPYHCTQLLPGDADVDAVEGDGAGDGQREEQVVLLSEHARVTSFVRRMFQVCLQVAEVVLVTPRLGRALLGVLAAVVESAWWVLHRTSTFPLSPDIDIDPATTKGGICARLQRLALGLGLQFPHLVDSLVSCLVVLTLVSSSAMERCEDCAAAHCRVLCDGMACSVNALTESGALPQVILLIHQHVVTTHGAALPVPHATLWLRRESSTSSPRALLGLVRFVLLKLAEMAAPSTEEELAGEVLDNLLSGLRHLLVLPLWLVDLTKDISAVSRGFLSARVEAELGNNSVVRAYRHLTSIWSTLEVMSAAQYKSAHPSSGASWDRTASMLRVASVRPGGPEEVLRLQMAAWATQALGIVAAGVVHAAHPLGSLASSLSEAVVARSLHCFLVDAALRGESSQAAVRPVSKALAQQLQTAGWLVEGRLATLRVRCGAERELSAAACVAGLWLAMTAADEDKEFTARLSALLAQRGSATFEEARVALEVLAAELGVGSAGDEAALRAAWTAVRPVLAASPAHPDAPAATVLPSLENHFFVYNSDLFSGSSRDGEAASSATVVIVLDGEDEEGDDKDHEPILMPMPVSEAEKVMMVAGEEAEEGSVEKSMEGSPQGESAMETSPLDVSPTVITSAEEPVGSGGVAKLIAALEASREAGPGRRHHLLRALHLAHTLAGALVEELQGELGST